MRLAFKFLLSVTTLICIVLAIDGYSAVQSETELHQSDVRRYSQVMGQVLSVALMEVCRTEGRDQALTMLEDADSSADPVHLRWIPQDADLDESGQGMSAAGGALPSQARVPDASAGEEDDSHIYTYVPAELDGDAGSIEIAASGAGVDNMVHWRISRQVKLTCVLVVVTTVSVLALGFRLVGRPIHTLVGAIRRVGTGDLTTRVTLRGHDELTELASEFTAMCRELKEAEEKLTAETSARIAVLEQLRHADRLATVGQLSAGIAHELGTPLNVIWGRAEMIAGNALSRDEIVDSARIIGDQSDRITRIIRKLLDFARQSKPEKTVIDVRQVAHEVINVVESMARKCGVSIRMGPDQPAPVRADREQIQQVLMNLMVNGIQAMPQGGGLDILIEPKCARPPEDPRAPQVRYWCVSVVDQGIGIRKEHIDMIFNPFFTTKEVGEGTGLGLSIAYGMVRENNGWMDVASEPGRGSRFTVYLPQEPGQ